MPDHLKRLDNVHGKSPVKAFCAKNLRRSLVWVVPFLVGSFLLLFRLSDVAGLHRDEATFGLFAEQIQAGLRPVRGYFNVYTSPVHSYIIAACFSIFGKSIWSLRISGVLLNLLAVCAYMDVVRRVVPERAIWTLWFLVTLPAFIVMARISGENYALNPLLLFGGIWCYYVLGSGGPGQWRSRLGYALCGLLFCLGVWNHIVFLPTALSVIATYAIVSRAHILRIIKTAPWFFLGVLVGAIPKLYGVLVLGYDLLSETSNVARAPLSAALLNTIHTLGGNALYVRACGEILLPFNWFLPLAVLASASILIRLAPSSNRKRIWVSVAVCATLSIVGTWAIIPAGLIGSRLWLLPLWFVPLLLSVSLPDSKRLVRIGLGAAIIVINVAAVGVNYFHNFLQDGGIPKAKVYVGGCYDNSWDFIDMRPLVARLDRYYDKVIYIEDFNPNRLRFFVPEHSRNQVHTIKHLDVDGLRIPVHSLIVLYKNTVRRLDVDGSIMLVHSPVALYKKVNQGPLLHIMIRGNIEVRAIRRPEISTDHYEVYEVDSVRRTG